MAHIVAKTACSADDSYMRGDDRRLVLDGGMVRVRCGFSRIELMIFVATLLILAVVLLRDAL